MNLKWQSGLWLKLGSEGVKLAQDLFAEFPQSKRWMNGTDSWSHMPLTDRTLVSNMSKTFLASGFTSR